MHRQVEKYEPLGVRSRTRGGHLKTPSSPPTDPVRQLFNNTPSEGIDPAVATSLKLLPDAKMRPPAQSITELEIRVRKTIERRHWLMYGTANLGAEARVDQQLKPFSTFGMEGASLG
jgi:hypothetical protein